MSELSKEVRHVEHNDGVHVAFYEDGELFYRAKVRESGHSMEKSSQSNQTSSCGSVSFSSNRKLYTG